MTSPEKRRVYRLRNLPDHVDRLGAAELWADCAGHGGLSFQNIRISSLAYAIDPWTRSPTKTATLTFDGMGPDVGVANHEIEFRLPGQQQPLILDSHFRGLTPLNDVRSEEHQFDCIVLSGLASHPFGSWQPHGSDKSFMWIRDEAPRYLPNIRFILYGYDTTLRRSNSFQTISDLANSFIDILKAEGWASPTAKPLIFLSHSMGGVLLKQALLMLAGSGQKEVFIANLVRGAVFFGVPSQGMPMNDVMTMLGDQPNKDALVKELSKESDYLPQLEAQFSGVSFIRTIKLFWAYETKTTKTITTVQDKVSRSGPGIPLVTRESATGWRCNYDPSSTIQLDENHSDMVKFVRGDHRIHVIASKLREIYDGGHATPTLNVESEVFKPPEYGQDGPTEVDRDTFLKRAGIGPRTPIADPLIWDDTSILHALRAPERDTRIEQIDPHSSHTFHWVYDKTPIGFVEWLRRGRGIFWVSGKPGSGKSTLMKFIRHDPRTSELLHQWSSRRRQITASFFFHYRGSAIQKSFDGLLRSIIGQILEVEPRLLSVVRSTFSDTYKAQVSTRQLGSLQWDLHQLISLCGIGEDEAICQEISNLVAEQDSLTTLQNLARKKYHLHDHELELELVRRRDDMLFVGIQPEPKLFFDCQLYKSQLLHIEEFSELVHSWLQVLDIETRVCDLLSNRGVEMTIDPQQAARHEILRGQIDMMPSIISKQHIGRTRIIKRHITILLKRHSARESIRLEILKGEWPRRQLEEVLRQICAQELFEMDLVLLLDALDEYDGRPEFISGFLKDLTADAAFLQTQVRILFSSRPWNIFKEEFSTCLGFQIHEHTQEDIRNYCITSIYGSGLTPDSLLPLVDEIVGRSKGVFLWVKLVLADLFHVLKNHHEESEDIQNQLRKIIVSLPDQLDEYYKTIIERISPASRWKTYVVLESLARSRVPLSALDLVEIIGTSTLQVCPTHRRAFEPNKDTEMTRSLIWEVTGGLVDIWEERVELMHQTVKEFIEAPRFRQIVLGSQRGDMTKENGHSFLSKYLISFPTLFMASHFAFHAREAERTTGLSQYKFFSTAINNFRLVSFPFNTVFLPRNLLVLVAAYSGLRLLLEDAYVADSLFVAKTSQLVLSALHKGMRNGLCAEDAIKTAESLVSKGLNIEDDTEGFCEIISCIWVNQELSGNVTWFEHPNEQYTRLTMVLLEKTKYGIMPVSWKSRKKGRLSVTSTVSGYALHLSPPVLAKVLLARGADPSAADSLGNSPLDYILLNESAHCRSVHHLHEMALLLVKHGGTLRKTTKNEWEAFIQHLENHGLETKSFIEKGFPRWYR